MRAALLPLSFLVSLPACGPEAQAPREEPPAVESRVRPPQDLSLFFDCVRASGAVISAHRGGPAPGLPENAIETFAHALSEGIYMLEVDVRALKDGTLVLHHDEALGRTAEGEAALTELEASDLSSIRLKDVDGQLTDYKLPTLEAALAWAKGRAILQLDLKRELDPAAVIAAVRAAEMENEVVIITYSLDEAREIAALAPGAMLSVSIDDIRDVDVLAGAGIPPEDVLAWTGTQEPNDELNRRLAATGIEVIFGTLGRDGWDKRIAASGDDGAYQALIARGIHVLATDRPYAAAAAMTSDDRTAATCLAKQETGGTP